MSLLGSLVVATTGTVLGNAATAARPVSQMSEMLELLQSIRPGDADPELDSILDASARGKLSMADMTKFMIKRMKHTPPQPDVEAETVVICPHCDRLFIMNE